MAIILIGGGARSGKTRLALSRARSTGDRLAYIATAQIVDDEMRERVTAHRNERGAEFTTIEEPFDLAGVVCREAAWYQAIVVDCLTLWLSNLMLAGSYDVAAETRRLIHAAAPPATPIIVVTNEVGSGIVPENPLARSFRDAAGVLNQRCAEAADEVYFAVFGCSLRLK